MAKKWKKESPLLKELQVPVNANKFSELYNWIDRETVSYSIIQV
jgi:hypothetical protein